MVMMWSEDTDDLPRTRNLPSRVGGPRNGRIIAPENGMIRAIRGRGPQPVRIAEVPVDVFPSRLEYPAIIQQRRLVVE